MKPTWDTDYLMQHHRELTAEADRFRLLKNNPPRKAVKQNRWLVSLIKNIELWLVRRRCQLQTWFWENPRLALIWKGSPCDS
jgi:hypothetical protein